MVYRIIRVLVLVALLPLAANAEIDVIDAWSEGNGARTASAAIDGLLLAVVSYEVTAESDLATVDFGATAMTFGFRVSQGSGGGVWQYIEVWYLLDAGIPAGSQNPSFAVTYTGNTPGGDGPSFVYALLDSVDQTGPINNTASDSSSSTQTMNVTVTTVAGGLSLFVANQKNGDSPPTMVWTGPTEQWDQDGGDFQFTGADDLHAGSGTLNGSVTTAASAGRMCILGIEFEPSGDAPAAEDRLRRRRITNTLGGPE